VTVADSQPSERDRDKLRAIVAMIDREISRLPRPATTEGMDDLIVSWTELMDLLGLAPSAPAIINGLSDASGSAARDPDPLRQSGR
jgi:hypothetical protein